MNDRTAKIAAIIVNFVIFVLSLGLVVIGQRNVGPIGLLMMLAGLAGLIFLLWRYNRRYQ